ncbi:hypothetical protein B6S12_00420 [Helicobacter valdiviensis]|uniref:DUF5644 domain-containing protein n=1 Tax=Helicobacter valdiviensis TaxID=1458358 RepID=A0A2W6MXJ7_9HELI|nr:DUF5644 domain-containing protein [Helicobacter valdiviensis]PZT49092.1 hypothetical protein B6S12_00420 [Helicobacter valdiviensis]
MKKIELQIFRFDIKTDYLPYYSKLECRIDENKSLKELLLQVEEELYNFGYSPYGFKINGVVVSDFDLKVQELMQRFGKEWIVEPLHTKYSLKDLLIDVKPFLKKVSLLEEFGFCESEEFILSFLPFAYATPIAQESEEYFGEAFLMLAFYFYEKTKDERVLELIGDLKNGIFNSEGLGEYIYPKNSKYDTILEDIKRTLLSNQNYLKNKKILLKG